MQNRKQEHSFWYRNGLILALLVLTLFSIIGQIITGWKEYNEFLRDKDVVEVSIVKYLGSGHFLQSTFENWESEFLQMAIFVILTIFLRQQGSSESKKLDEKEECERKPQPKPDAPWPVNKGGVWLALYKHSLSIALVILFIASFYLHWFGSWRDYNLQQQLEGKSEEAMLQYLGNHRFWFESFQNWQSEFLSVFVLVFLSIYLRQQGSPQSKPVDASYEETGE